MAEPAAAIAAAALLLALGCLAWLRPLPDRLPPPALPAAACEPWMADALPGVGPRSRERVAAEIRQGRVPAAAREWFATGGR